MSARCQPVPVQAAGWNALFLPALRLPPVGISLFDFVDQHEWPAGIEDILPVQAPSPAWVPAA